MGPRVPERLSIPADSLPESHKTRGTGEPRRHAPCVLVVGPPNFGIAMNASRGAANRADAPVLLAAAHSQALDLIRLDIGSAILGVALASLLRTPISHR